MTRPPVSVYVIAYNEADKIRAALESVRWADEIVLVDSHSQDDTVAIARDLGARVEQVEFRGYGDLRNRAMALCSHQWIFSLDADERCTPEVRDEILATVADPGALDVYFVPRRNIFLGRWIKHCGFYPDYRQPQLFRRGALLFKDDLVHEEYEIVGRSPAGYLRHDIWQLPYKDLAELQHKANKYSTLGAQKLAAGGRRSSPCIAFFRGLWSFCHIYLLKLGILDGWPGFLIALGNFEGTFYKYAKLYELKRTNTAQ